jgi:hypothetical protein
MKKIMLVLALILSMSITAACGNDNIGGSFEDPYDAYGLVREKSYDEGKTLDEAMSERPPSAIILQPVFYYRPYYNTVSQGGQFTLEKGKSANISLDMELIHTSGEVAIVKSSIIIKYDGKKGEDLFHADTNTYGNPTLYVNGVYTNEYGNHNVKDKEVYTEQITKNNGYQYMLGGPAEEFLCIPLGVDKGNASQADGNIGFLYCRIIKVKK